MIGLRFLRAAQDALGGPAPGELRVDGRTGLGSPLAVGELAVGAVAAQLLAARVLAGDRTPVELDARHVGFSFRSERHARQGDRRIGSGFAPLSRFVRTADGWLRLHGNYPHHRAAALRVLGDDDPVAAAAKWTAEELLRGADAVVQGYRPGAPDAFGLDPVSLAERHPNLVVVRLRAWGDGGPWERRRGFADVTPYLVELPSPGGPGHARRPARFARLAHRAGARRARPARVAAALTLSVVGGSGACWGQSAPIWEKYAS